MTQDERLTHRAFLAVLIREMQKDDKEMWPLWLCTADEYQDEALAVADRFYNQWVENELKQERERIRHAPRRIDP